MRRARVVVLTVLLLGTTWAATVPFASSSLTLHNPIVILNDAAFTPLNGVVGGTGTPGDPFVISGWHIKSTAGVAIRIEGVTKSFLITANLLEASGTGAVAVSLAETQGDARVESNQILYWGIGVLLTRSDALVAANQLLAKSSSAVGVQMTASDALVRNNMIDAGAVAISVDRWGATVQENTITASAVGVRIDNAWWVDVTLNTIDRVTIGVQVGQGAVNVTGNTFIQGRTSVSATGTAPLNLVGNTIDGAQGDAVVVARATVSITGNLVVSALGRGIVLTDGTGIVSGNTVHRTKGAISALGASVVRIQSNQMWNNEFGLSIPYSARASIPHLSANFVNGVDTAFVYHWQEANYNVVGGLYDANFAGGFYGGLTQQGAFVFYDVNTAVLAGVTIRHQLVGVTAVNSFNIQVENSFLLNAKCAIVFNNTIGFVKNNTITIPTDPPATCGVDIHAGVVGVFNNTISNFEFGIRIDAFAKVNVTANVIFLNTVGIQVAGSVSQQIDAILIAHNEIRFNSRGAVMIGFRGMVLRNNITFNTFAGIELRLAAHPTLQSNNISFNFQGVVDANACVTIAVQQCSGVIAKWNTIGWNVHVGIRVNATATLTGNLIINNTIGADLRGTANLQNNVIIRNDVGAKIRFRGNVTGDVAIHNRIGYEFSGFLFTVIQANVSANFHGIVCVDLPPEVLLPNPQAPTIIIGTPLNRDPLFVHLTTFIGNRGDAIRAPPTTFVNATYNYWGDPDGPRINVADQIGAFQNGITAGAIHFIPWWVDPQMSTTGPAPGL